MVEYDRTSSRRPPGERQTLPSEIAALSAEASRIIDTMTSLTGTHISSSRLSGSISSATSSHLAKATRRRRREFPNLEALDVEAAWVARCLTDFDGIWNVLTPENRGRLLRAVIQRVAMNTPSNRVSVFLADLGAKISAEAA